MPLKIKNVNHHSITVKYYVIAYLIKGKEMNRFPALVKIEFVNTCSVGMALL